MTNIAWHRRYNWHLVWRQHRQAGWLFLLCLATGLMLKLGEGWLLELNARISAESAHLGLIGDVWRLTHFGTPGTVTDFRENTVHLATLRGPA